MLLSIYILKHSRHFFLLLSSYFLHLTSFQNSSSSIVFKSPFLLRNPTCSDLYLNTTSPFSSPPNSHGSTSTTSPSRTHSVLFTLPGILQTLTFPSMHFTLNRDPPNRCSITPMCCPSLGNLVLLISSSCCSGVSGT